MLSNIGKILLVDDRYDDVIKKAVTVLIEKGMSVQFWDGKGDFPDMIRNVRVVILDLDLAGLGTRSGPEFYYPAVEALKKIPGPFIVVIMAMDFHEDDPFNLDSYYKSSYGSPLCGFIAKQGLSKDEELEDPSRLETLIISSVEQNKILNLILLWEQLVDKAKDKAFSDLVVKEIESTVLTLIKSLCKDFGEESAARELANVMMRLISRRICEYKESQKLNEIIKELNAFNVGQTPEYPSEEDLLLYNRLMFYTPESEEDVWTGDIYRVEGFSKYDKYAIVLTPVCHLVQGKTTRILTCFAFPLDEKCFDDPEYPPNKVDPAVLKRREKGESDIIPFLKERYIARKQNLPDNFHIIWNFKDEKETFGICFDFNNVRSMEKDNVRKWKRICRLDSPFVEEILEKYGKLVSRIGTLEINRSPDQLRASLETLDRQQ
jgi:hypothetical protein